VAILALRNVKNASGVDTGKALIDKLTISVILPSGSSNLIAIASGFAFGPESSIVGIPPALVNLTVILLAVFCKCATLVILLADLDGANEPVKTISLL
jgi:hypothetical protein